MSLYLRSLTFDCIRLISRQISSLRACWDAREMPGSYSQNSRTLSAVITHVSFVMFVSCGCGSLSFNLRSGPVPSDPGLFPGKFMPWILSCESKSCFTLFLITCTVFQRLKTAGEMAGFCCLSLILALAALTVCVSVLHKYILHSLPFGEWF